MLILPTLSLLIDRLVLPPTPSPATLLPVAAPPSPRPHHGDARRHVAAFFEKVFTCHTTEGCRRLDEDVNGPHLFCFIKRVRRQTVQSQIDYAASLHWSRCLPQLPSSASRLRHIRRCEDGGGTAVWQKKRKVRENRFVVFVFILLPMKSQKIVFFLKLISRIICSLRINHGAPSGICSRGRVRNSHSDLN